MSEKATELRKRLKVLRDKCKNWSEQIDAGNYHAVQEPYTQLSPQLSAAIRLGWNMHAVERLQEKDRLNYHDVSRCLDASMTYANRIRNVTEEFNSIIPHMQEHRDRILQEYTRTSRQAARASKITRALLFRLLEEKRDYCYVPQR